MGGTERRRWITAVWALVSVDALLPLTPSDRRRTYRLTAIMRSVAIAVLGTVLMWEFRDASPFALVALALWMYPGVVVNWWVYRRAGGVIPPHVWVRDIVSFSVFAALLPSYFVPTSMGLLAILAFVSYTAVRRTVTALAVLSVIGTTVAAVVVRDDVSLLAAAFFPLGVLAIVLPSQVLAPTMHRSLAFNESIADALDVAMFESVGTAGQPLSMFHLYASERRGLGPAISEEEWLEILHPDDLPISDAIDAAVTAGRDYHVRYRQLDRGGEYRWTEEIGRVVTNGDQVKVFGMTRDVTPAVSAQEQLMRLDRLAESIDVAFSVLRLHDADDPRSLEVVWENAASRAVGPSRQPGVNLLVDLSPTMFEEHDGVVVAELAARVAREGVPVRFDGVTVRFRNVFRNCSIVISPLPDMHCGVIVHDVTELVEARRALERLAYVDPLTGLANRVRMRELLAAAPVGSMLFVVDLDRFTDVNEAFGHGCGDEMIVEVARVLAEAPEGAVVARLGGDEFAILVSPHVGQRDELVARIFQALTRPVQLPNGLTLQASISMGITSKSRADTSPDELFRQADVALTAAKEFRNGHVVYDPRRDTSAPHRMMLLGELRRALVSGELELHHQPAVDCRTGRVSSVEALLVWRHPSLGLITASELTEMVELSNLHADIVVHSLREAVRHWHVWHAAGHSVPVSINVDARTLRDATLVDRIVEIVATSELPLHAIGVEIDERQVALTSEVNRISLARLREVGLWLTIDHFGGGKNPIHAVRAVGADAIKLDRRAVAELMPTDDALLAAMRGAVHRAGLLVASDGADDDETFRWLVDHGVDQVQGPYVGGLMTVDELLDFLLVHRPVPVAFG